MSTSSMLQFLYKIFLSVVEKPYKNGFLRICQNSFGETIDVNPHRL